MNKRALLLIKFKLHASSQYSILNKYQIKKSNCATRDGKSVKMLQQIIVPLLFCISRSGFIFIPSTAHIGLHTLACRRDVEALVVLIFVGKMLALLYLFRPTMLDFIFCFLPPACLLPFSRGLSPSGFPAALYPGSGRLTRETLSLPVPDQMRRSRMEYPAGPRGTRAAGNCTYIVWYTRIGGQYMLQGMVDPGVRSIGRSTDGLSGPQLGTPRGIPPCPTPSKYQSEKHVQCI